MSEAFDVGAVVGPFLWRNNYELYIYYKLYPSVWNKIVFISDSHQEVKVEEKQAPTTIH